MLQVSNLASSSARTLAADGQSRTLARKRASEHLQICQARKMFSRFAYRGEASKSDGFESRVKHFISQPLGSVSIAVDCIRRAFSETETKLEGLGERLMPVHK